MTSSFLYDPTTATFTSADTWRLNPTTQATAGTLVAPGAGTVAGCGTGAAIEVVGWVLVGAVVAVGGWAILDRSGRGQTWRAMRDFVIDHAPAIANAAAATLAATIAAALTTTTLGQCFLNTGACRDWTPPDSTTN